jgi:hypothetical protein
LGYEKINGSYKHYDRKVLFLGDYIDRGPKILESLQIVRNMVDSGNAIALMGNHEYNALCFHLQKKDGGHLRKHSISNIIQHYETLKQFHNKQAEFEGYLEWFKSLPLFYENDNFRAVHACWDQKNIDLLKEKMVEGKFTDELIYQSVHGAGDFYDAVDQTLKGKEMTMPDNLCYEDHEGTIRREIRIKWWEDPTFMTYKSISVEHIENLPELPIKLDELKSTDFYPVDHKKVFFGHYWLKGEPAPFKENIFCLDYSIAKGGKLVAYRLGDENSTINDSFFSV